MKWFLWVPVIFAISPLFSQEVGNDFVPASIGEPDFRSLKSQSPFTRSINLSDSLILTGIATVDQEQVATLLNKETKETYVVSSTLNSQGWKMVELKANEDLEKVSAKVSVEGGEVVTVRYAEWQLKPGEAKPGAGPAEGESPSPSMRGRGDSKGGDSRRGGPPSEIREKMMKLSEEQRGQLFQRMREMREKNPDMPREKMGEVMKETMDKMLQQR